MLNTAKTAAWLTGACLMFSAALSVPVHASGVEGFYKGKVVVLTTGNAAGGGYDLYLRLLAQYFPKYIPGNPTVVVENRGGAGGLVAMNYAYNLAPKDGTQIIMPFNYDPVFQLLRPQQVKYDLRKMPFIGNITEITSVLGVSSESGVKSIEQAREREVILGASGPSSESSIIPRLLNALVGTRFKIASGYPGAQGMFLAMERGETFGRVGSWYSFKLALKERIAQKRLVVLAQDGGRRSPELPDVPLFQELSTDPSAQKILALMSYPGIIARTLAVPPGVPAERIAALREAFMKTMHDPDFRKKAKEGHLEVHPTDHTVVEDTLARLFSTPNDLVVRTNAILDGKMAKDAK